MLRDKELNNNKEKDIVVTQLKENKSIRNQVLKNTAFIFLVGICIMVFSVNKIGSRTINQIVATGVEDIIYLYQHALETSVRYELQLVADDARQTSIIEVMTQHANGKEGLPISKIILIRPHNQVKSIW